MIGTCIGILSLVAMAVGSIWLLVVAFEQETAWGVACLLLPPVAIVFAVKYWNRAAKPIAVWLAGFLGLFVGKFMRDGTIFWPAERTTISNRHRIGLARPLERGANPRIISKPSAWSDAAS